MPPTPLPDIPTISLFPFTRCFGPVRYLPRCSSTCSFSRKGGIRASSAFFPFALLLQRPVLQASFAVRNFRNRFPVFKIVSVLAVSVGIYFVTLAEQKQVNAYRYHPTRHALNCRQVIAKPSLANEIETKEWFIGIIILLLVTIITALLSTLQVIYLFLQISNIHHQLLAHSSSRTPQRSSPARQYVTTTTHVLPLPSSAGVLHRHLRSRPRASISTNDLSLRLFCPGVR